ncbi:hypothetical protein BDW59DRAFT_176591 [Aspergillus cavernicola]|uniref:NAD(P)-binding protein n=1 Tax=Aspergillus cavernicola TaxID=176166 RepID=A0ABR4HFL3_9EURO
MPPPRGTPNLLEGPGDYDVTSILHNDTYPAIDPLQTDFSGKAVLVTGASKGIGRAVVLSFARAGASFIAAAARSDLSTLAHDVAAAATSAHRSPPIFLPLQLDVTDAEAVQSAAATVEQEFGSLDVLVNNAGTLGKFGGILATDPDEWWQVMDLNLRAPYLVSRAFLPLLLRGALKYSVYVSSVAAHLLNPTFSAYQTSKMAVLKFAQLVDAEFAKQGVVSFAIHPGNCPTDIMGGPDNLNEMEKLVFVDTPQLSADTIVFLASEKREWLGGRYINGTWDMPELMAKRQDIVHGDKLKVKFIF